MKSDEQAYLFLDSNIGRSHFLYEKSWIFILAEIVVIVGVAGLADWFFECSAFYKYWEELVCYHDDLNSMP